MCSKATGRCAKVRALHVSQLWDLDSVFPRLVQAALCLAATAPPPAQSPGPRPRPVGGDDTSPGLTPDSGSRSQHQAKENSDLVIGSWNEECEKDNATSAVDLIFTLILLTIYHRVFWWSYSWG